MKNILIVDDIKGWIDYNSQIVKEILGEDVNIYTARFASEAYDILLTQTNLDFIITDLQMEDNYAPKYAGEWLIEQIKTFNQYRNTKVIIISASFNARQIAESYGVSCIPKSTALKCFSAYKELIGEV